MTSPEAFDRETTRLEEFCERNDIKVLDDIRRVQSITDRVVFDREIQNMFAKLPSDIAKKFKTPASIEFMNNRSIGSVEDRIAAFKQ